MAKLFKQPEMAHQDEATTIWLAEHQKLIDFLNQENWKNDYCINLYSFKLCHYKKNQIVIKDKKVDLLIWCDLENDEAKKLIYGLFNNGLLIYKRDKNE